MEAQSPVFSEKPGRGFSAAGPGAMPEKQAMQRARRQKRGRKKEKNVCCYFKKRISYCRFVSAETERASITHTPCPNTGGIPPNKRLQEGKSGA